MSEAIVALSACGVIAATGLTLAAAIGHIIADCRRPRQEQR